MIGIENTSVYIPRDCRGNLSKIYDGESLDAEFVKERVGFLATAWKDSDEETSDMCAKAFSDLQSRVKICPIKTSNVFASVLITVIFSCLILLRGFMEMNNFSTGVLFTCDPCSKILNPADKSTDLVLHHQEEK